MPELVVGREAELAALSSLLGATGLRVAVLTGDPGCGKSTLVEAVVQRARSVDHLVLRAQPREFERDLAFSALADLLEPVQDLQAVPLPGPQRTALRAALLLDDGDGPADPRAVAAGLRTVIAHLAERCPVLVAVDDTQWLDTATSQVLRHAVRRLVDVPVALLVATRPVPATADWPTGDDGGRVDLALSGLTEAALFHLIRDRLGQRLGRDTLRRVARASGGNPLYALELARSLAHPDRTVGRPDADDPFTASLDTLVGATVHALPVSTRRVLLAAALVGDPTPDRLGAACDLGERPLHHSLDEAARAEVARVDGGRVRFRHPLLAAAVVAAAGPEDRRAMHAALAEHETDVEARARHLAHAADDPDGALAQQLAGAADHARQRGGLDAARELLAMAVSSIPGDDRSGHAFRLKLAAWALHDGDPETARQILAPLVREENEIGGRAHVLLARIALFSGSSASVGFHARAGLALAGGDALLRADAMLALAETFDDVDACLRHAVVAQEVLAQAAPSSDRDRLLVLAQQAEGSLRLLRGDASGTGLLEQAAAREGGSVPELVSTSAAFALAQELLFANRLTESRDVLIRLLQLARDSGDEASEPIILLNLGHLEVRAGRFQASEAYTRDALALSEIGDQALSQVLASAQLAEHEARRGSTDDALDRLGRCAARAAALADPWLSAIVALITGRVLVGTGDHAAAAAALRDAEASARAAGMVDLGWQPYPADLAEALIAAGDTAAARVELHHLEHPAGALDRPHVAAAVPRVRAQVLAAEGYLDAALTEIDTALRLQQDLGAAFEVARTRLVAGRLLRRAKQKRRAHDELSAAAEELDRLGAPGWATQARRELARVGLRPSAPGTLTDTEARVADLAAAGRTNREIALEVFVSPKTVEGILGRVYRKLGVRSRVELARARSTT